MSMSIPTARQSRNSRKSGSSSGRGLRTPRVTEDAVRGLSKEFSISLPINVNSEDFVKKFGPLTVEVQQALTAVLMLESPEMNIVIDSLNALQKFLKKSDENKELYVEMGGLPPVKKKMFEENMVTQRLAMKILALASVVHKAKLFIRDTEICVDLLTLAQSQDDVITEYSTYALSNLATLHTGRIQLVQQGSVPILVNLTSHPDPDIERNALESIWQLAADPLQLGQLINEDCINAVLKLVESEYPPLQAIALVTLEKVATRPDGIAILESLNGFVPISSIIRTESMIDLHRHCLKILFHECRDRGTCKKYGTLTPAIVEIIERTQDTLARINALDLLGRLCSVELVAKNLAQCGVPQMLYGIFSNAEPDLRLKEACAFTVAQISRSAFTAKRDFARCLPFLLEMLETEGTTDRGLKCSLIGTAAIVEDISSVGEFSKANGFPIYKKFLENYANYPDDAILCALCTIDIIAGSAAHRPEVVQADYLPLLMQFIKDIRHPQILTSVCSITSSILGDTTTHEKFKSVDGPETLLNIVNHEEVMVVAAIVPIMNVACTYPHLGKVMLDKGLLQAMWRRTDLMSNGPFRACFDRLIAANLTVKYAVTGHISPFERLTSGFCDMGGISRLEELKLPEDFTWEGRDPRRKVILIGLENCELDSVLMQNNSSLNNDNHIDDIISQVKKQQEDQSSETSLVEAIAKAVSDRFGGPLDQWRLTSKAEDIEIENLQNQFQSVIIPISALSVGSFRVRALVFKAVCDSFGIPCSLETNDYRKAWNVVLLRPDENTTAICHCVDGAGDRNENLEVLSKCIVDLAFQPGILMSLGTFEGDTYISAI